MNWEKVAAGAVGETETVDFKSKFDKNEPGFWCKIVKDLVSFSNTDGGVLVFRLDSDGSPTGDDCSSAAEVDVSEISNQVLKYTSENVGSIKKFQVSRFGIPYWCISCDSERVLLPFTQVGSYEVTIDVTKGKPKLQPKTEFRVGVIYVRHGSKSEPCTRDDLIRWRDRELNEIRDSWLSNIRKVVEAPIGQTVVVSTLAPGDIAGTPTVSARLTNDPNALPVRLSDPKKNWPYRRDDVLKRIKDEFPSITINSHDLVAVKHSHGIDEDSRPDMMLKTHQDAGPQYSNIFLDWIIGQFHGDSEFFKKARTKWRFDNYSPVTDLTHPSSTPQ